MTSNLIKPKNWELKSIKPKIGSIHLIKPKNWEHKSYKTGMKCLYLGTLDYPERTVIVQFIITCILGILTAAASSKIFKNKILKMFLEKINSL